MSRYIDNHGDVLEKIRKLTEKNLEEKRLAEIGRLGETLQKEQKDVEIILTMIHDRLFFKKEDSYSKYKYRVITEEEFLKDYTTEPKSKYTSKGIWWNENWNDGKNCYQSVVSVNGISYFDMRYIMWAYEQDIDNVRRSATNLKNRIIEIENQAKKIQEQYPAIVQMMKDWQEWQEQREVTE